LKTQLFALFTLVLFFSCSEQETTTKNENSNVLSFDYFKNNLKPDMTYNSLIATFGEPSDSAGSGVKIYIYQLSESSEIWIGYADKIIYAAQMDQNHKVINTILGDNVCKYSYEYFKVNLKADMTDDAIISTFGEPSEIAGSGIHIFIYRLADSTEVWIGYADKIIYASLMDNNHENIENIIK
jgi:hypothetical protein